MGAMSISRQAPPRVALTASIRRSRDTLPEGASRAFLAGVEAAVLGFLCLVVPAIASYVATAAAPALGDATWLDAAAVGSAVWRLGHGGLVSLAGVTITLVPLGVTALAVGLAFACMRRAQVESWTGILGGTLGYASAVALLAALPPASLAGAATAALGGLLVGAAGTGGAVLRRRGGVPPLSLRLQLHLDRIPEDLRGLLLAGARGAGLGTVVLLGLGALLVLVSLAANLDALSGIWVLLRIDPVGVAMLVLAIALLIPTAAVWAIAWVSGTGFAVGVGTVVAPDAVTLGALPLFPLVAAVPRPWPVGGWTVVLVVVAGAGVGWYLHRRAWQPTPWLAAGSAACAALGCGAIVGILALAASGSIGPGRMVQVGPDPLAVSLTVAGLVALGSLLVVLGGRPETAQRARLAYAAARDLTRAVPGRLR
jgi:hypothetical protein